MTLIKKKTKQPFGSSLPLPLRPTAGLRPTGVEQLRHQTMEKNNIVTDEKSAVKLTNEELRTPIVPEVQKKIILILE